LGRLREELFTLHDEARSAIRGEGSSAMNLDLILAAILMLALAAVWLIPS